VYAPSDHHDSASFLEDLAELVPHINGPWVLAGDFNLIRSSDDKNNDRVDSRLTELFNDTINSLALLELPLLDRLFTWSNRRESPTLARLDRVFLNTEMSTSFPNSTLTSLTRSTSDHIPLVVNLSTSIPKTNTFRFENSWLFHQDFLPCITPAWNTAPHVQDAAGDLASSLKASRYAAKVWYRGKRAPPLIMQNCKFLIALFDLQEEYRVLSAGEHLLRGACTDRLQLAIRERAAYWKQRGKFKAIREADANTAFHHAHATNRFHRNQIKTLTVNDCELTAHDAKAEALTAYFSSILGTLSTTHWQFSMEDIYREAVTPDLSKLTAPFTVSEAKAAVQQMNRNSAPGPDGFGPGFYSAAWDTVVDKVMSFIEAFAAGTVDLERVNRAFVVLLPKKQGATAPGDHRPICLQNCSMKIIAKILTSRLQEEIPKLIDLDQTGFIKGRSISENFIYALELVQHCHKQRLPTLVLKLDFAKAFDSVNWDSLLYILQCRGFPPTWCSWIQHILTTSKSAILLNGCPCKWFTCKKGLRQGDPHSPYLFLLVRSAATHQV